MSFPGIFRRLFQKEGAGPLLRKEIIPPHSDTHATGGGDPIDLAALGGVSTEELTALHQQVAGLAEHMGEWRTSWIGVPRPWRSTALPPSHCWANGDFVAFADWPELEQVYAAGGFEGMLMPWDADGETQAANLGQWRPDAAEPTGLYVPDYVGHFMCCWGPGAEESAGGWHRDEIRNISGTSSDVCHAYAGTFGVENRGGAMTSHIKSTPFFSHTNKDVPAMYISFDASRMVPTGKRNVPQHIWSPQIIYLGKPAKEAA